MSHLLSRDESGSDNRSLLCVAGMTELQSRYMSERHDLANKTCGV